MNNFTVYLSPFKTFNQSMSLYFSWVSCWENMLLFVYICRAGKGRFQLLLWRKARRSHHHKRCANTVVWVLKLWTRGERLVLTLYVRLDHLCPPVGVLITFTLDVITAGSSPSLSPCCRFPSCRPAPFAPLLSFSASFGRTGPLLLRFTSSVGSLVLTLGCVAGIAVRVMASIFNS